MGILDFYKQKRRADQPNTPAYGEDKPRTYALGEVFTPGQPADKGFVSRPVQERDLKDLLDERGTQVLVWGESGAGKSSLVTNVLRSLGQEFIVTRCESTTTYDQILASGFDRIQAMRLKGATNHDARTLEGSSEIGGVLSPATVSAGAQWELSRTDDLESVVEAQRTSEALAVRLGAKDLVWVIEDFHKVKETTRNQIADAMKVFSDESVNYPKLRVIVLGVAESAAQILQAPSNMGGRLATLQIPPLSDGELLALLDKGKDLLNVDFSEVHETIIRHSVGVASVTHALAAECCTAMNVRRTSNDLVKVVEPELFGREGLQRTLGARLA